MKQVEARVVQRREPEYGWFQLNQRFNSDQIPSSFVNGQSNTWAPRAREHVAIMRPYSGLGKRGYTTQSAIGPGCKSTRCAIIRGTRQGISKLAEKAYGPRADVLCRKSALADGEFCMMWAKIAFARVSCEGGMESSQRNRCRL